MSTSNLRHAIKKIVNYFELFWSRLVSKFEKVPKKGNLKKSAEFYAYFITVDKFSEKFS
jgi:hypothetical protein